MLRVSPAVSPRVVARTLSTQNTRVTAGTLTGWESVMGTLNQRRMNAGAQAGRVRGGDESSEAMERSLA